MRGSFPPARLVLAVFFLFSCTLHASPVSVRVLSLLSLRQVYITPVRACTVMLRPSAEPPTSLKLPAGKEVSMRIVDGLLQFHPGGQSAQEAEMNCPAEIRVQGDIRKTYAGSLHFYTDNNTIQVVLHAELESLVASILESEHGALQSREGLKAMAVTVRTFLLGGPRHAGAAGFCDTTHCQVFQGYEPSSNVREAARQTSGWVLAYRGRVFHAFYSRECGGRTAEFAEVWGEPSPDYPFPAVNCPCGGPAKEWTSHISISQLALLTGIPGPQLTRKEGWVEVAGASEEKSRRYSVENFRTLLGRAEGWKILPSNQFRVRQEPDAYAFSGKGSGHGVGLCQTGLALLADTGLDYRALLQHYFPGTSIVQR